MWGTIHFRMANSNETSSVGSSQVTFDAVTIYCLALLQLHFALQLIAILLKYQERRNKKKRGNEKKNNVDER